MKIALYKEIKYGYLFACIDIENYDNDPGYIRVSEPVDVEFPMLDMPSDNDLKIQAAEAEFKALNDKAEESKLKLDNLRAGAV